MLPKVLAPDGRLSLSEFKSLDHIVVDGRHYSHGHQEAERLILETVDQRRVRMVSETFMVTALIAETNDLVLTVPRSVARVVRSPRMTVVTPPLDQIGRASCRERVCQYGVDLGGRRIIKKKK